MLVQYPQKVEEKPHVINTVVIRPGAIRLSVEICTQLVGIATSIVIARTPGPAAFGIYSFVFWLATVAVPVVGIGMSNLTGRDIADMQSRKNPRIAAGIFRFIWQRQARHMLLYCGVYLLLIMPIILFFKGKAPAIPLLLAGIVALIMMLSGIVGLMLRSLRRFNLLATIHLFGAVMTLFLICFAAQTLGNKISTFLLASAIAGAITLSIALACIMHILPTKKAIAPGALLQDRLTRGLSNSFILFILDVIVWQRSEILLLAKGQSAAEMGFYALSALISARIMNFAPTALSAVILPLALRFLPNHRYINAADAFVRTTRNLTLLSIPLCILSVICCPFVIHFCLGDAFLPVVTPLRILLISAAFGSISTVSLTHLASGERKQAQLWLGGIAAALNIVLAIPCILLWGVTGAAIASAAAQMISALGSMLICKKLLLG